MSRKLKLVPKLDAREKVIEGRFVGVVQSGEYTPRILRGAIELPHEQPTRARADAKRARRRSRNLEASL